MSKMFDIAAFRAIASKIVGSFTCLVVLWSSTNTVVCAESMSEALARTYITNPQLNAQRADTRATDENLPNALSGYRPTATASGGTGFLREAYAIPGIQGRKINYDSHPNTAIVQLTQNIFNGFRTYNQVLLAHSQILSSRESLKYTETAVLVNAAAAYMDVMRDAAVLRMRKDYVNALEHQLTDTCTRLRLGEVTTTDVSQARASLSQGRVDMTAAMTQLTRSKATYEQIIGVPPSVLQPAKSPITLMPRSVDDAYGTALQENPLIAAALRNVESAEHSIKIAEGQLLPSLNLVGNVGQDFNYGSIEHQKYYTAQIGGQLSVPLYDGGVTYSNIRQAKEKLIQAQQLADQQRMEVRASTAAAFAAWKNSHSIIAEARAQVDQTTAALGGIREEARLGQRTTFDILYAQQSLVNARIVYVTSQHDQVVAAYSVLAAIGRLSAQTLGLNAPLYKPEDHYDRVKGKWAGTSP
jgi:outer membrane protein